MRSRTALVYGLFVALGSAVLLWRMADPRTPRWFSRSESDRESTDAGTFFVPAQAYGEDGLRVSAEVTKVDGGRRVVLRLEQGEMTLTLFDPVESSDPTLSMAFGKARLETNDDVRGAAFLAAFTRFLGAPERKPRIDRSPLVPLDLDYVRLAKASGDRPEAMKLFLHGRRREAEVFFDLWPDGARAGFLEKDEIYRSDLIAILADALRDGPPPHRTPESDPHLESDTPLFSTIVRCPKVTPQTARSWTKSRSPMAC